MFTGIVEETGKIKKIEKRGGSAVLEIECKNVLERYKSRR